MEVLLSVRLHLVVVIIAEDIEMVVEEIVTWTAAEISGNAGILGAMEVVVDLVEVGAMVIIGSEEDPVVTEVVAEVLVVVITAMVEDSGKVRAVVGVEVKVVVLDGVGAPPVTDQVATHGEVTTITDTRLVTEVEPVQDL